MPKSSNSLLSRCESLAATVKDYRKGEITEPNAKHVECWVKQFPERKRLSVLRAMDDLLESTYLSKLDVREFLKDLLDNENLLDGDDPKKFWNRVNFIRIQGKGSSQSDLLRQMDKLLRRRFGFTIGECGAKNGPYFYLDDFIFTGSTVRRDILHWLKTEKPKKPQLHLVFLAYHNYGQYNASRSTSSALSDIGGNASYWRIAQIEDRKARPAACDALRPRKIYSDPAIKSYAESLRFDPALRAGRTTSDFYETENGRRVLENQLLKAGLRIRGFSSDPDDAMRPLGFSSLESFGTGAIVATYRNCPNTAPLAWWWGDPASKHGPLSRWYPLLPRKYRIY